MTFFLPPEIKGLNKNIHFRPGNQYVLGRFGFSWKFPQNHTRCEPKDFKHLSLVQKESRKRKKVDHSDK